MAELIFKNNAQSTIAGAISPTATSVQVQAGTGILFAQPTPGQYWVGTFIDSATGLRNEIVHVTQMVGDTATIVRGQEGTAPQAWEPNDSFSELWTAGQCGAMLQQGDEQSGSSTFGQDVGVANAYSAVLTPALTVNTMGQTLRFRAANNNTGASTVNFGTGAAPLLNAQGQPLSGGEIIANYVYECYWNGAGYNMAMPSLVRIPTGMVTPFAGGSVPTGWLACIGQIITIISQPALFAVLGTVYGGDGATTFGIPDLRGRVTAGLDGGAGRLTTATINNPNASGGVGGQQQESAGVSTSVSVSGGTFGGLSVTVSGGLNGNINNGSLGLNNPGAVVFASEQGDSVSVSGTLGGGTSGSLGVNASGSGSGSTSTVTNVQPTMTMNMMIKT